MIGNDILTKIKEVDLPHLLAGFGIFPSRRPNAYAERRSYLYLAAYRNEQHPSLSVFRHGQQWLFKDHATGEVGTNLDLLVLFNFFTDWRQAAAYVAQTYLGLTIDSNDCGNGTPKRSTISPFTHHEANAGSGRIEGLYPIIGSPAEAYITSARRIPIDIAAKYVQYAKYSFPPNPKVYSGIAWPNILGGWSIRWAADLGHGVGKTVVGPAGISIFNLQAGKQSTNCAVFEGIFDFLAWVVINNGSVECDAIVLNSAERWPSAVDILQRYAAVELFLDRDPAGHKATANLLDAVAHATDRSEMFAPEKDFNDYLIHIN